ncbi:MAG: MarR family transcriptional regulator [Oscillospiraceae bacterium]|nr:MarR family transcriptional regulator [Oscillospiraceae bacterium]
MQKFAEVLHDMLVTVYHKILRVEEDFLQRGAGAGLTLREMHTIEYIGRAGTEGRNPSEIAEFMEIARPSATVSVRKLEQKGFLIKSGCTNDGRAVRVTLTRMGRKVFMLHMHFHMMMVKELESGLCEEEKDILVRMIQKLDRFFEKNIEATT